MKVTWSAAARRELQLISEFIAKDQPAAAQRLIERVDATVRTLEEHPHLGRRGRARGTRELAVPGTPYLLIYSARRDGLEIVTTFDARRKWPPAG